MEPDEFTDQNPLGFHGGFELGDALGKKRRAHLAFGLYHHRFPVDVDAIREAAGIPAALDLSIDGGTFVLTEVFAFFRYDFTESSVRPYVLGGLGAAHFDITDVTVKVGDETTRGTVDSEIDVGLSGGLGVTVPTGPVDLFAQARFTMVLNEGDNIVMAPITIGVGF